MAANRAARPVYAVLIFIGPPLAGCRRHGQLPQLMQCWYLLARRWRAVAAGMPLLRFYRGRNAARTAGLIPCSCSDQRAMISSRKR